MLLVRQVALPKVPCFALWSCFPMVLCAFPGGSYSPMVPCFALWSCFPMVLCTVPGGSCFPMVLCFALWSCFPMVLCTVPGGSCFSMLPHQLQRRISQATASAERQPLPHRLPLRFIPPAALRLRAPLIHEGHWRPRSVRKSSRLLWKHHLPSCSFARPGCSLIRPRCARLLAKPEYFPAE